VLVVAVLVAEYIVVLITSMLLMIHILLLMTFYRSVFMQAGIEKLHVEGRIRITFDPLVDKLPVIGAVKVRYNESP